MWAKTNSEKGKGDRTMTREEAIDILRSYLMFDKSNMQIDIALNMAIEALSAEDVVPYEEYRKLLYSRYPDELVRCKDCRFYWGNLGEDDTDEMYGECRWDSDEMPNDDDFCSYGERREP
jgi:hypothetical protein